MENFRNFEEFNIPPCMWFINILVFAYIARVMGTELAGRKDGEPGKGIDQMADDILFIANIINDIGRRK